MSAFGIGRRDAGRLVPVLGVLSLGVWTILAGAGDLTGRVSVFLGLFGVVFVLYLVLLARSGWGACLDQRALGLALFFAVLFRVAAVASPPSLSDDLYRYLWDGRVLLSGVNPFRHAPGAPEVARLRLPIDAHINHPEVPTIYPPAAQLLFAGVAVVSPLPRVLKTAIALVDLGVVALLLALMRVSGLPPGRVVIYAWSPLVVLEFAGMGHVDVLGILFMVAALVSLVARRPIAALAWLGVAGLAKLLPLVLAPLWLARVPRRWWWVLPGVLAVGYLPFVAGGVDVWVGLRTFLERWRGNEALFSLVAGLTGDPTAAREWAGVLVAGVLGVCLVTRVRVVTAAIWVLGTTLLVAPVVHPWYLTWLLPFLCLTPVAGLTLLTGTVVGAYTAWSGLHAGGAYHTGGVARAWEYLPPAVVLVGEGVRRLRQAAIKPEDPR